jgi:hypothetical protein
MRYSFSPTEIEIPQRIIAARLGFKGMGHIPEEFKKIYDFSYKIACRLSEPMVVVECYGVKSNENALEIDDIVLSGKLVEAQLKGSEKISAMLVTLGDKIDMEISRLHKIGKELESFFLDGIGSEMVEFTARKVDGILRERKTLNGSARISPGYVDLPLNLNKWFAQEMGKEIGVVCDEESFTFLPRKTISAFIGWSK